jgi:23S rRNA (guanosine2251-2'-O)-methyltransferase
MREFIYSRNAVYETLRAKRRQVFRLQVAEGAQDRGRLSQIVQMAEERKIPILRAPRRALDQIHVNHQGVVLETSGYPYAGLQDILDLAARRNEPLFALILDALQDPQNLGTLLRTAEAVGVHGVLLPLAHTAQVTPAVVNASSGASEHILIAQANLHQAIGKLKEAGAWIVGLEGEPGPGKQEQVYGPEKMRLDGPLALVVGSEGSGMRPLVRQSCDLLMSLPMVGHVESLNAAVAGSIALYLAYLSRMQKI